MDIDIILAEDVSRRRSLPNWPSRRRDSGFARLWSSNYHQNWDCFLDAGAGCRRRRRRILLGPLAVSPWEMHPLKITNALLTLNEMSNGRAMVAISRRRRRVRRVRLAHFAGPGRHVAV